MLRSISNDVQTIRLPFSDEGLGELAYSSLADGRVFVALTFPSNDQRLHTVVRYFAVRLAPAP